MKNKDNLLKYEVKNTLSGHKLYFAELENAKSYCLTYKGWYISRRPLYMVE